MADYHAVALDIKPVDPNRAFDSINNILGLQQKRQGLQIQAQELQQQELKTQQQQGVQQFFQQWDPTEHISDDGTTDTESVHNSAAYKMAGNAKPLIDQQLISIKTGQLQNKQALSGLNNDLVNMYARNMGALADDPDVQQGNIDGQAKVKASLAQFSQLSPDTARVAQIIGPVLQHAPPDKLNHLLKSQQMLGADVLGQRGQQNPQETRNSAGQIINRNVGTGALSAAPNGAGAINPTTSDVAGRTAGSVGTASGDRERANEIGGMQQDSSAAIAITKHIDQLATEIHSGHLAKMISESGNYLGFSSVNEARSQLNKDLGRVRGLASARAGSDSRAATLLEGYPTDTTPENTIHAAMDYLRGTARQNLARGQLLTQYQKSDPQGLRGFQAADNILSRTTNPLMHEYLSLKPDEQKSFYRHNFSTAKEAQAFKDEVNALKKHSRVFDQQ